MVKEYTKLKKKIGHENMLVLAEIHTDEIDRAREILGNYTASDASILRYKRSAEQYAIRYRRTATAGSMVRGIDSVEYKELRPFERVAIVERLREERDTALRESEELDEEIDSLLVEIDEARDSIEDVEISALQQEINEIRNANDEKREIIEDLKNKRFELQKQNKQKETNLADPNWLILFAEYNKKMANLREMTNSTQFVYDIEDLGGTPKIYWTYNQLREYIDKLDDIIKHRESSDEDVEDYEDYDEYYEEDDEYFEEDDEYFEEDEDRDLVDASDEYFEEDGDYYDYEEYDEERDWRDGGNESVEGQSFLKRKYYIRERRGLTAMHIDISRTFDQIEIEAVRSLVPQLAAEFYNYSISKLPNDRELEQNWDVGLFYATCVGVVSANIAKQYPAFMPVKMLDFSLTAFVDLLNEVLMSTSAEYVEEVGTRITLLKDARKTGGDE